MNYLIQLPFVVASIISTIQVEYKLRKLKKSDQDNQNAGNSGIHIFKNHPLGDSRE